MSEDDTRTGFKFGLGSDVTKTSVQKKISIRLKTGKVFGPYQRSEVLSFIQDKKIHGEEAILIEDALDWVPITSDLEFFDALQAVMNPEKSSFDKGEATEVAGKSRILKNPDSRASPGGASLTDKNIGSSVQKRNSSNEVKHTRAGSAKVVDLGLGRSKNADLKLASESASAIENLEIEKISPAAATSAKKTKPLRAVLISGVALVAIYLVATLNQKKAVDVNAQNFGSFTAQSWYARPLAVAMDGFAVNVGALPTKLDSSLKLDFPDGFNAIVWIEDLKALEKLEPQEKLSTRWWLRWSWSAYWLGMTLWTFDKAMGEKLMSHSLAIVKVIEDQNLLKEPAASLFKGAQEFRNLYWSEAAKSFDLVSAQAQMAAWLNEESKWLAFWTNDAKGEMPKKVLNEYESGPLETSSQVRAAFVDRNEERYKDWIEQLAAQDPLSSTLWFTTAQVNWKFNKEGTQTANKLFTIGLGSLALQPQPVQLVFWKQFSEFMSMNGRQSTTAKAKQNYDAIFNGNLERNPAALQKWWDLNQEEFDLSALAAEVYRRSEAGSVIHRDLATLFVLGYVIPNGSKYLAVAGNHFALEKNWPQASKIYKQISKVDRNSPDGWGGLVWVNASQFKFDEAFFALDELNKLQLTRPENFKYEAMLYSLGREYERAGELFEQYIRKAPNDPWAHYFQALNYLAQSYNVQCVTSANLALAHAQGELQQKSRLLLYKCRVLAKIQVKEAIEDLHKMAIAEPNNASIAVELIDAQLATDLDTEAEQFTEAAIRRFTRSYELRMKRGDIFKKAGDYDRAVAYYQRAIKDRPESVEPMIKVAEVYDSQGKLLEAAQSYEAASIKSPEWPEIFLKAARAYVKIKKYNDAARLFEREVEARPAYVSAYLEAAEFYLSRNDPNSVIRIFSKVSSEFQDQPRVRTRLAQAYLALKQMDKAADEAHLAISQDPKIGEAHRVLGLVYDDQGQYELAKKHLENYLLLIPGAVDSDTIKARISSPPYQ